MDVNFGFKEKSWKIYIEFVWTCEVFLYCEKFCVSGLAVVHPHLGLRSFTSPSPWGPLAWDAGDWICAILHAKLVLCYRPAATYTDWLTMYLTHIHAQNTCCSLSIRDTHFGFSNRWNRIPEGKQLGLINQYIGEMKLPDSIMMKEVLARRIWMLLEIELWWVQQYQEKVEFKQGWNDVSLVSFTKIRRIVIRDRCWRKRQYSRFGCLENDRYS